MDETMIGRKFHKLTVIGFERDAQGHNRYLCECECGNHVLSSKDRLESGRAKSCGCNRVDVLEKYAYLVGEKINRWTVLELIPKKKACSALCRCECGTEKEVGVYNLITGKSKDCGCGRKQMLSETRTKNMVGQRFGRLTVTELLPESNNLNRRMYICKCDCGNEITVSSICLREGKTESCGCMLSHNNGRIKSYLVEQNIAHTPEYAVFINGVRLRFDFFLPDYNTAIEYDGEQHYFPVNFGRWKPEELEEHFRVTQERDRAKDRYCEEHHIHLLRIPYWEAKNIETIIKNHLQRLSTGGFTEVR